MYEVEPQDRVHDILAGAVFGDQPLGRRVLGEAEVISSVPVPEIEAYRSARYTGAGIVVGAAGNVDHGQIEGLAERLVSPPPGSPANVPAVPPDGKARLRSYDNDPDPYHICLP